MKPQAPFEKAEAVSLPEMLEARERRAQKQKSLLDKHRCTLVSFTLNIPGPYKVFPLATRTFEEGIRHIEAQISPVEKIVAEAKTGNEAFFAVDLPAEQVKKQMVAIEERHPLGRLFDMDVFDGNGNALRGKDTGRGERTCLLCGEPVWVCARSRAHSAEELALQVVTLMRNYFASNVAEMAVKALLYEVAATPKPGLVDKNDNGAHRDMDIFTFIDSAVALTSYFRDVTWQGLTYEGETSGLLALLRPPGIKAEQKMLAETHGINTHKGAIFTFGLMCAAMGLVYAQGLPITAETVFTLCREMAGSIPDELIGKTASTHGERAYVHFGLAGIRGEAAEGYPHVRKVGFPKLKKAMQAGHSLNDAGILALIHLIACVEDTNIVTRSDLATLHEIQQRLQAFLADGPDMGKLLVYAEELNAEFVTKGISPGGSADLLAASYFLYFLGCD